MIEPLTSDGGMRPNIHDCMDKINELVDAINDLQVKYGVLKEWIYIVSDLRKRVKNLESDEPVGLIYGTPEPGTPTDPYAEQRKWIGTVCRFWNEDETEWEPTVDVLDQLRTESDFPFVAPNGVGYKHCEPITADDKLIYKGE